MTLSARVRAACDTLGIGLDAWTDEAVLRSSYRAALRAHPPDRDPEGFRKIREAYELLRAPVEPAMALLKAPLPLIAPPRARPIQTLAPGSTAVALLRLAVTRFPVEALVPGLAAHDAEEERA